MNAPKRLCLILLGVTLYTTSIGAEVSSADLHLFVGICKANETLLCLEKNKISFKSGKFLLINTKTELLGNLAEKCESSKGEGNLVEEMGNPLNGKTTSLSFTGCSPCATVKSEGLPYEADFSMETEGGTDYLMSSSAKIRFSGCPFGVECTFSSGSIGLKVENKETGAVIRAEKEPLELTSGSAFICGKKIEWDAPYEVRWDLDFFGGQHNVWFMLLPFF